MPTVFARMEQWLHKSSETTDHDRIPGALSGVVTRAILGSRINAAVLACWESADAAAHARVDFCMLPEVRLCARTIRYACDPAGSCFYETDLSAAQHVGLLQVWQAGVT